jgi:hypothetical protein
MVPPGETVVGLGVSLIDRSPGETVTEFEAVLLAALVSLDELTDAEPAMLVFPTVAAPTVTTSVKEAVPAFARFDPSVQVIVPVAPTAGFTQLQPAATVREVNVVFVGVT